MAEVLPLLDDATRAAIVELAELPLSICGFGPVKHANAERASERRSQLLEVIRDGGSSGRLAAE